MELDDGQDKNTLLTLKIPTKKERFEKIEKNLKKYSSLMHCSIISLLVLTCVCCGIYAKTDNVFWLASACVLLFGFFCCLFFYFLAGKICWANLDIIHLKFINDTNGDEEHSESKDPEIGLRKLLKEIFIFLKYGGKNADH